MSDYNHGTYGVLKETVIADAEEASTATVAVGTLPVHLLADFAGLVGVPIPMADSTAKSTYAYSPTWEKFSLCEAMQCFLGGSSGNIGGLYCINVLDPSKHKASTDTEVAVTFVDGIGTLADELAIVSTIAVDGVAAANTSAEYDWTTGSITIKASDATGAKNVTYRRVNPAAVTDSDIVAGIAVIDDLYPQLNVVPNMLIAPGWSEKPAVYAALTSKAQSINSRFYGFVVADIPTSATTIEDAIAWKAANDYTSKYSKVCWPCVSDASGEVYHASTLFAREMVRNDAANGGVPFVTASNTVVSGGGVCLHDGTAVKLYQEQGNSLNAYGISTAIAWGGQVRLWGGHTARFIDGGTSDTSVVFDTNIRMLCYLINSFILRWIDSIDQPMTLALRDTILFAEQGQLDGLVAQGALIGSPTIQFLPSSNSVGDLAMGEFTFDIAATPQPQFKTARAVVAYTTDGFSAYIESEDE